MDFKIKFNWITILFVWIVVQSSIIITSGINTNGEALRFIQEANHLLKNESFSTPIYFMYLLEIVLIFLKLKFSFSFSWIIGLHLLLNLFSVKVFYDFINKNAESERKALFGGLLLIICIPFQYYNSLVYTESIFFSLGIIYSCFLLGIRKFSILNYVEIFFFMILLCLTRPSGIFFVTATFIYIFLKELQHISFALKLMLLLIMIILIFSILNAMMKSGQGVNVLLPFKEEHIICDVATVVNPDRPIIGESSLYSLVNYVINHPEKFLKLVWLRSLAFLGLMRPYYSIVHNAFLCLFFYPIYGVIIFHIIRTKCRFDWKYLYCLSLIFIFWLSVIFSCDEWHSRFFLTLTPFLILMAVVSNKPLKKDLIL
jgi:hypothetical protein